MPPAEVGPALGAALRRVPVAAIWGLGLLPLGLIVADALGGRLGVDPVVTLEHRLGNWALYLLIAGLAVTPLMRATRINLLRWRRPLGLLAALYAALHLSAWAWADMGFLWGQMLGDVVKRPWLSLGMAAALMLVPLAATSNDLSIRRMGARSWRRLHRLVYLAVPLAGVHAALVGKITRPGQVVCLALIALLLGARVWHAWAARQRRS